MLRHAHPSRRLAFASLAALFLTLPSLVPAAVSHVVVWNTARLPADLKTTRDNGYTTNAAMQLWWKCDSGANVGWDSTGNARHGTLKGTVAGIFVDDPWGNPHTVASGFNAPFCYMVANPGVAPTADRTYEFWIRNPSQNDSVFFSLLRSATGQVRTGQSSDIMRMWVRSDGSLRMADRGGALQTLTTSALTWDPDTWYQIAVVLDVTGSSTSVKVYRAKNDSSPTYPAALLTYTSAPAGTDNWLAIGGHEESYQTAERDDTGQPGCLGFDGNGTSPSLTLEQYGAVGDNSHDDQPAWRRACAVLSAHGQGTLTLAAGKTYLVGKETLVNDSDATTRRYEHDPMGLVVGARLGKVLINGNGSTIKLKGSGQMHFGSFDPVSGAAVDKTNTDPDEYITYRDYASDIGDLLRFEDCLDVEVTNIILDGNLANQVWGGYYADKGVQCRQSGLYFLLNDNVWVHDNVVCKNNSLDGIGIKNEVADETAPLKYVKIEEVSCQYNGRQGLSYNCGNHLEIYNSDFSYTGRTTVGSPSKILNFPGAGIDLEPIGRYMRAGAVIENCTFFDNREVGLLLTGATPCIVRDCTLWQSTEWTGAGWSPRGGRAIFVYGDTNGDKDEDHFFIRCNVYGQIYNRMGRRLQFEECNFIQANSAFYGPHNQNEPVYSRPAIESPNTGGAMHFDACNVTITQNNASGLTRSVWAYNIVLENSTVHHASYKLNPPSLFVARLYDNFLLNTHFTEAGFSATNRFFIEHDASGTASKIGPGVELTGSHYITWGNTTQTLPISATEPINPNITWKVLTPNPSAGETGVATTATYSVIDNPFTAAVDINPFTNPADPGNTRLFDGDSPDDWNHTAGINWVDQAIDINLHATYNVRSVKIRMKHLVTQRPMRVWVHVGNGTTWTPMGLLRPNERDNTTNPDTWYTLTLPATLSGSHVRLVFENEGAWGWYINEVKVYGN